MRKKTLSLAAMAIVAVVAAVGVSKNANKVELSDFALANVEALASGEFHEGTCGYSPDGILGMCNVRQDHVLELYYTFGGYWCCDSCSSTTYCGS